MNQFSYNKIHFIAIGGSVMHNLAIALHKKGITITGSDDEIYEPALGKLEKYKINASTGWDAARITEDVDAVILGMHAKEDNPELLKAKELNIPIFSFPEFIYELSKNKQRIVIGGSHGKSSITAMIMHVLKENNKKFDYLVGAELPDFELTVGISDAPIIILEGDEYLSSKLDKTPKFLAYKHHIGVISGVAWDHKNVFPTFDDYTAQFDAFADQTPKAGTLIYNEEDSLAKIIGVKEREDVKAVPYKTHDAITEAGKTYLKVGNDTIAIKIFGKHNLQNINAAKAVCKAIGITEDKFYEAIANFSGASKRLELIAGANNSYVFKDYAHSPSKLEATTTALKQQFTDNKLVAIYELHTFSSLDGEFVKEYKNTLKAADQAFIFINPSNLKVSGGGEISEQQLKEAFKSDSLALFTDIEALKTKLKEVKAEGTTFAFMSSGNFQQTDLNTFAKELV